jgi:hypothetical protein
MRFLREDFPRAVRALEQLHIWGDTKHPGMESLTRPDAFQANTDAMVRHLMAEDTQMPDAESGLPSVYHTAWRAVARLEVYLREHGET